MQTTFFLNSKRLLCVALLLWQGIALAQAPDITWQKSFGGDTADYASAIRQTTDGGYIIAGSSNSNNGDVTGNHGDYDYWIVKLDANSNLSWQKSLGGSGYDVATAIQETADGGYIIAGYSASNDGNVSGNHGGGDMWIVKLYTNSQIAWQKCIGGSSLDYATDIQQCTDGGYIIAGYSASNDGQVTGNHGDRDYSIVKLDASGNYLWQKSLGGSTTDIAYSIQQTTEGGYIIAGESLSIDGDITGNHGEEDYWIVKLDANGNLDWQRSLGGSNDDDAYSIQQTADGGYIVAGMSGSTDGDVIGNDGGWDYWIVKLTANGTLAWQKSFGGGDLDRAISIQQTTDGGYIVAGYSYSIDGDVTGNHGTSDSWIVKLAANGNLSWQKILGGSDPDGAFSIQQATDGGYIVAGSSRSIDGDVTGNHGGYDYWIVKLGGFGVGIDEGSMAGGLSVYPNPVIGNSVSLDYYLLAATEVEVRIMNVLGNNIAYMERGIEAEGEQSRAIEIAHLASGVYFLELRTNYGRETVRWVKE